MQPPKKRQKKKRRRRRKKRRKSKKSEEKDEKDRPPTPIPCPKEEPKGTVHLFCQFYKTCFAFCFKHLKNTEYKSIVDYFNGSSEKDKK